MIKQRVIELIEYKNIPKEIFYVKIGMTSANFRGNAKKTPLNSTAIENILSEIPDVNAEWLLTGKGNMLKTESTNTEVINMYKLRTDTSIDEQEVPLYEIETVAGLNLLSELSGQI